MGGLHRLFEDRARETPDAVALVTEDADITYAELDRRANGLARRLLAAGLLAGETAAVVSDRRADVVVAVLAVLKAGGAYAVIDPDEPMGEIGRMLAAARARVVVTNGKLAPRVDDGTGRPVVRLESAGAGSADAPDAVAGSRAAVLFTSGASGPRRPVEVGHARLRAAYAAWAEVFELGPADRHLVTAAPDVPAFTGGWVRALCSGGALVLPGRRRAGTTVLDTDPASVDAVLDEYPTDSVRLMAVGGERLTVAELARLQGRLTPGALLLNVYGTAEVAGCGTWFEADQLEGPEPTPERVSLLGRPFPGCAVEVADGEIRLTPPDGGAAVPTGDLGRLRADGLLEFRGRQANRTVVRGRTVDPYEAEAVLAAQPEIRDAVIVSAEGELVAYVAPRGDDRVRLAAVRDHLHGVVPEPDVPDRVVNLAVLPRDRAGRVARRMLPLLLSAAAAPSSGGKGGGQLTSGDWSFAWRGFLTFVSIPAAFLLTGVLWPGSTDLSGVPQPWAALFVGLYIVEIVAFAVGVGFLLFGRQPMLRQGRSPALTTLAHLAIVWLLVSWWPQDNAYRLAAKNDWPQQAALVYTFNVTLMISAAIVMIFVTRRSRPAC